MRKQYLLALIGSMALTYACLTRAGEAPPRPEPVAGRAARPGMTLHQRAERARELRRIMKGTPEAPPPAPIIDGPEEEQPGGADVTGVVIGEEGLPVVAVHVRVCDLAGRMQGSVASTDDRGRFRLPDVSPGPKLIAAADYADRHAWVRLDPRPGRRYEVRLVLARHEPILLRGKAMDRLGRPVYSMEVAVQPRDPPRSDLQRAMLASVGSLDSGITISTDLDGTFEVPVAESGWYRVSLRPSLARGPAVAQAVAFAGPDARPTEIVVRVPTVECRLVDGAGTVVPFSGYSLTGDYPTGGMALGMGGMSSGTMGSVMRLAWPTGLRALTIGLSGRIRGQIELTAPGPCQIRGRPPKDKR